MRELFIFISSLTFVSIIAAQISILARSGSLSSWYTLAASILPAIVWSLSVRYMTKNLTSLSFTYDIIVNITWLIVLLYNGEVLTVKQWIGVFLFFVALFFVA